MQVIAPHLKQTHQVYTFEPMDHAQSKTTPEDQLF